jgi:hypothetical protein
MDGEFVEEGRCDVKHGWKKAEGRRQMAEGRSQRAEGRRQKAEGRRQRAEGRGQKSEGRHSPTAEFIGSLAIETRTGKDSSHSPTPHRTEIVREYTIVVDFLSKPNNRSIYYFIIYLR